MFLSSIYRWTLLPYSIGYIATSSAFIEYRIIPCFGLLSMSLDVWARIYILLKMQGTISIPVPLS